MKINLEPKFSVYNNKVVKCELKCSMLIPYYALMFMDYEKLGFDYTIETAEGDEYEYIVFNVSAIAKCDPTDTFDEVAGKRISESRATIKALNTAGRVLEYIFEKRVLKFNNYIVDADEKLNRIFEKELKHLDTLLGKDE